MSGPDRKVMKAESFAYRDGVNVSLDGIQRAVAQSLNACVLPAEANGRYTLHVVVGKGDWKYKREFLRTPRHYGLKDHICARCFCSGLPEAEKPWVDPVRERFNNVADLASALESSVGHDIPRLGFSRNVPAYLKIHFTSF